MKKNYSNYLQYALSLANQKRGYCAPNPSVGAVIVNASGEVIAEGYHCGVGMQHAEVVALNQLKFPPTDATLFITLEPCCHQGKTPPCTDAIIRSGIKRVVFSFYDPNLLVAGKGKKLLEAAGIQCEYFPLAEVNEYYVSYQRWQETRLPTITAKLAMTLDGKIANNDGSPIKITGDEVNQLTHYYRDKHDALLTTSKTIIQDNPKLNVRINDSVAAKPLYILDTHLAIPLDAVIFTTMQPITIFYSEETQEEQKLKLFFDRNIRCIPTRTTENKWLNLDDVLAHIGADGIHDLWVEAGSTCFNQLLKQNKLNKIIFYMAPDILGGGISAFPDNVSQKFSGKSIKWEQYGRDVVCTICL